MSTIKIIFVTVLVLFALQSKAYKLPISKSFDSIKLLAKEDTSKKERTSRQVVKLNLIPLRWKNLSFQYEYGFHNKMSGALGVSFLLNRPLSDLIWTPDTAVEGWTRPSFQGWSVTPEFRFYPGAKTKNQAPHGFYIATYFRYSKFTMEADYVDIGFTSYNVPYYNKYSMKSTYSVFTGGLMIGSQWIINKHFSLDWWILGGGAGSSKLVINVQTVLGNVHMSTLEQEDLKNDIAANIDELGYFSNGRLNVLTSPSSAEVTIKGIPMFSFRGFGLSLGYAF